MGNHAGVPRWVWAVLGMGSSLRDEVIPSCTYGDHAGLRHAQDEVQWTEDNSRWNPRWVRADAGAQRERRPVVRGTSSVSRCLTSDGPTSGGASHQMGQSQMMQESIEPCDPSHNEEHRGTARSDVPKQLNRSCGQSDSYGHRGTARSDVPKRTEYQRGTATEGYIIIAVAMLRDTEVALSLRSRVGARKLGIKGSLRLPSARVVAYILLVRPGEVITERASNAPRLLLLMSS